MTRVDVVTTMTTNDVRVLMTSLHDKNKDVKNFDDVIMHFSYLEQHSVWDWSGIFVRCLKLRELPPPTESLDPRHRRNDLKIWKKRQ